MALLLRGGGNDLQSAHFALTLCEAAFAALHLCGRNPILCRFSSLHVAR
jgi:hypothetical protein